MIIFRLESVVMRPTVYYFEIPVNDLERAISFYGAVFGCQLDRVDVDGNQMANFPSLEGGSGASGALAKGDSYIPSTQGIRVYFDTDSIDDTLAKAVDAGGKILYPKTSIGELGWVAEFEDSEGNCIALSQPLSG
jgi:predicted enzyme related to lactoylglutathione lyase